MKNQVTYKVYGKRALFSDPIVGMGGEKSSYSIPTYEALRGITESIYWKPTIDWVVDEVRIMNPIKKVASGQLLVLYSSKKKDLSINMYLMDVCYEVKVHFIQNVVRPDLKHDFIEQKHLAIMKRSILKGGRAPIFLGTSECVGMIEPVNFGEDPGYYDNIDMDFDMMFKNFEYPEFIGRPSAAHFFMPKMKNGIISFADTKDKVIPIRNISKINKTVKKVFAPIKSVDEEYKEALA